jgi:predicted lipid-binding transport protein (Tim44 family)
MLCPNCGTTTTTEHKFCRSCGMNLEPVSRALAAHLSPGGAAAVAAREARRRATNRMAKGVVSGIAVVLFGMFVMSVIPGNAFKVFGVAAALIGLVSVLASIVSALRTAADLVVEPAPRSLDDAAAAAKTGRLLHETTVEPVPSVTERTTDLLGVERKVAKPRRD